MSSIRFKTRYEFIKYIRGLAISFVFWFAINSLYIAIRYDAISNYNKILGLEIFSNINHLNFSTLAFLMVVLSLILSLFSWNFYFFLDRQAKFSVAKRLTIVLMFFLLLLSVFYFAIEYISENLYDRENFDPFQLFSSRSFYIYFIFLALGDLLLQSLFNLKDILGPEMFRSILRGKYANPKEEERIFMFMDLYNSTAIAEKLGHLNYSRFIQECYELVTDVIVYHKASIYQYIGDEIVFTWRTEKGILNNHCIELYFDVKKLLESNSHYFMEAYGVVPEFKAGLHSGLVTAVQVGVIKRELAYHGDVLNTAARLQEQCSQLNAFILLSEDLKNQLDDEFIEKGSYFFKGKSVPTKIFTLEK